MISTTIPGMIKEYFGSPVWIAFFGLVLFFIFLKARIRDKIMLIVMTIGFSVLFFNPLILSRLGEGTVSTFYRFLWMIPFSVIGAFALVLILRGIRRITFKIMFIVVIITAILGCGIFSGTTFLSPDRFVIPRNQYNLSPDVIDLANRLEEIAKDERIHVLMNVDLQQSIRTYTPHVESVYKKDYWDTIATKGLTGLKDMKLAMFYVMSGSTDMDPEFARESFVYNDVEYVVIPSYGEYMRDYMKSLNCNFVDTVNDYDIYKFAVVCEYDDAHRIVKKTVLDADGRPVTVPGEVASVEYVYTDGGTHDERIILDGVGERIR